MFYMFLSVRDKLLFNICLETPCFKEFIDTLGSEMFAQGKKQLETRVIIKISTQPY